MKESDKQRERQLRGLILSKGEDYGGETFTDFYNQVKAIFMPPISNEVGKESIEAIAQDVIGTIGRDVPDDCYECHYADGDEVEGGYCTYEKGGLCKDMSRCPQDWQFCLHLIECISNTIAEQIGRRPAEFTPPICQDCPTWGMCEGANQEDCQRRGVF